MTTDRKGQGHSLGDYEAIMMEMKAPQSELKYPSSGSSVEYSTCKGGSLGLVPEKEVDEGEGV